MLGQLTVPKNLCILRLSAIGDVCHAVAMVQHIQHYWPSIQITWVIGKIEATLLQDLPNVEFIIFDKKAGIKGYLDLCNRLKGKKFDVLLHMQVALRASIASLCISAKTKIGFDRARAKEGQWLFTNKKISPQVQPHVLDGFFAFAEALGLPEESPTWKMPIADKDIQWASKVLNSTKPIAIIVPSASKVERNWHYEGYASVAKALVNEGFEVVLCGGPTTHEKLLAEQIITVCDKPLTNLVGQTTLKQLLAVLKQAHLVIAPDTGPAHMAVTVGTPVIGLYAHSNPLRTGPYNSQQYVVSCYQQFIEKQKEMPLEKLPWGVRAKGSHLMSAISVKQVTDKISQLMKDNYPELISTDQEN